MKFEGFPYTLTHKSEKRVCHFQCKEHVDKYIERHKLKKKDYELQQPKVRKPRKQKVSGSTGDCERNLPSKPKSSKKSAGSGNADSGNKRRSRRST